MADSLAIDNQRVRQKNKCWGYHGISSSCHEDGLLGALTYRNLSRLHGTTSLFNLCLPTTKEKKEIWLLETLQGQ